MRALVIPLLTLLCLSACSSSSKKEPSETDSQGIVQNSDSSIDSKLPELDGQDMPVSSTPSENQGFNVISNQRYNFNIDVPAHWQAIDQSDAGDGFVVKIPTNRSVSISVYGEKYDAFLQDFYEEDCMEIADFTFYGDQSGKRCIGEDEVSYWLISTEHKLNVHVEGWSNLSLADKTNLTTMVQSMRASSSHKEA